MAPYKRKFRIKTGILRYFRDNLGTSFIIAFMMLLITCAALLAIENEKMANELAVYAYYSLVIGVLLQLTSYVREKRKKG